jgi:hypothetical protein
MMAKVFVIIVIVVLVCTGCSSPEATVPTVQRQAAQRAMKKLFIAAQLRAYNAGVERGRADCEAQAWRGDKGRAQKMALEMD